jgi:hypothetical protein
MIVNNHSKEVEVEEPQAQSQISTAKLRTKNPFKLVAIILGVVTLVLGGLSMWLLIDNFNKADFIANIQAENNTEDEIDTTYKPNSETPDTPTNSDQTYLNLPKIGMRMPLSQESIDKLKLTEIDNSYRLDVKMIADYRNQGYCGNGGSSAIGMITKKGVGISKPAGDGDLRKSNFFDTTLTEFDNNVIYPKDYITFNNIDAACWDLNSGGTARGQEVANEVQKLNDALADALINIESIK